MRKILLAATAIAVLSAPAALNAAEAEAHLAKQQWSFDGVLGKFDKAQVQRGFQVYKDICAACHGLRYLAFRNFEALGYSEEQVKALAAQYQIEDGPDDNGDMFKRKGKPSDYLPMPFPNDAFARAANNGALPPDLSLMTKAREGGPDYVYNLLLGYDNPPADIKMMDGMSYNRVFPGNQIAMVQQIQDGVITFADGAPNDAAHIAMDATAFLHWVAEPKLEARHSTGLRVLLYTLLFTVLAYFVKRRIWARIEH